MPELPEVTVYIDALERRILGGTLERIRLASPFLVRSFDPPITEAEGRRVEALRRIGKRIAIGLEDELWLVLHLMIAGRLHWREPGASIKGRRTHAAFDFETGSLTLTEAGTKKRASLHLVRGEAALADHDPGGLELAGTDTAAFSEALTRRNHTLKRALTDPRLFSGIGGGFADEILHRARLSPITWTGRLEPDEIARLHGAAVEVLTDWVERLRDEAGDEFPEKVSAFKEGMAVHGRYGEPCPDCETPVQRIRYASNETNYCSSCQTGGRVLADRALSRLLKGDWPRTVEELEELRRGD